MPTHLKALYRRARASRALDEYKSAAQDVQIGLMHCKVQLEYLDNVRNAAEWAAVGVGPGAGGSNTNDSSSSFSFDMTNNSSTGAIHVTEAHRKDLLLTQRLLLSESKSLQLQIKGAKKFELQMSANITQTYESAAAAAAATATATATAAGAGPGGTAATSIQTHDSLKEPAGACVTHVTKRMQHVLTSVLPVEPVLPARCRDFVY